MLYDDQSCVCIGQMGRRVGTASVVLLFVDIASTYGWQSIKTARLYRRAERVFVDSLCVSILPTSIPARWVV